MSIKNVLNISKIWHRFSRTDKNGKSMQFRWEQLPEHRFEEFVEFKLNYFVKHAVSYVSAGIPKNPEAIEEYRQVLLKTHKDSAYNNVICCVDDESSNMVAIDSLKLYKRGDVDTEFEPVHTAEVQNLFKLIRERNKLCSISKIMEKYGVDKYYDDRGMAVHPDFRGYRMTPEASTIRIILCSAYGVPLTGTWVTSAAVEKITERQGWETIYEISYEELEKIVGMKFQNTLPMYKFKVKRSD